MNNIVSSLLSVGNFIPPQPAARASVFARTHAHNRVTIQQFLFKMEKLHVNIDITSDVVCPWYIARE